MKESASSRWLRSVNMTVLIWSFCFTVQRVRSQNDFETPSNEGTTSATAWTVKSVTNNLTQVSVCGYDSMAYVATLNQHQSILESLKETLLCLATEIPSLQQSVEETYGCALNVTVGNEDQSEDSHQNVEIPKAKSCWQILNITIADDSVMFDGNSNCGQLSTEDYDAVLLLSEQATLAKQTAEHLQTEINKSAGSQADDTCHQSQFLQHVLDELIETCENISKLTPACLRTLRELGPGIETCPEDQIDCNGDCRGSARMEPCAQVCYAGTTTLTAADFAYLYDCAHQCNGTFVLDDCSVCAAVGAGGSKYKDCTGKCYPPAKKYDMAMLNECGVCVGGDTGLSEDAGRDQCGVCGGDNSLCVDCNGVPNGGAVPDACGVCGGDSRTCFTIVSSSPAVFPAMKTQSVRFDGAGLDRPDVQCLVQNVDGEWTTGEIRNPDNRPDTLDCVLTLPPCTYSLHLLQGGKLYNSSAKLKVYNSSGVQTERFELADLKINDAILTEFEFWGVGYETLDDRPLQCIFEADECFPDKTIGHVVTADRKSDKHLTCALPMPTLSCTLSVFLSANSGLDPLSQVYNTTVYASAPSPSIRFSETGYHLEVTFDKDVDHEALTCCTYIFANMTLLGQSSKCWWPQDHQLIVRVGQGESLILPGDELAFKEGAVRPLAELYSRALAGSFRVEVPANPPLVTSVITGPTQISWCDAVTLSGSRSLGGAGRDLIYRWSVQPDLETTLRDQSTELTINGSLLRENSVYTISLEVENIFGITDRSSHHVTRMPTDIPSLIITSNVDINNVKRSSRVELTADVRLSPCAGSSPVEYFWSTSHPAYKTAIQFASRRRYVIEPFTLPAGENITLMVTARYSGNDGIFSAETTTLKVMSQPLVAHIAGGVERFVSRKHSEILLDGSMSHDPDMTLGHMAYSWSCIRDCGSYCYSFSEDSLDDIFPFGSVADASTLTFDGRHLGMKVYLFTLTVSKGKRSAATTVTIRVTDDLSPTIVIGPFPQTDVLQQTNRLIIKAYVNAVTGVYVQWRMLGPNGKKLTMANVSDITRLSDNGNSSLAVLHLPLDSVMRDVNYTFVIRATDSINRSTEARSDPFFLSPPITGCRLEVHNYTELSWISLHTKNCQIPISARPVSYAYGIVMEDGRIRHLTESNDGPIFRVIGPSSQSGTATFTVEVCSAGILCESFRSDKVNVIELTAIKMESTRERIIQQVAQLVQSGDYLSALVSSVTLFLADRQHHVLASMKTDMVASLVNGTLGSQTSADSLKLVVDQLWSIKDQLDDTEILLRIYEQIIPVLRVNLSPTIYGQMSSLLMAVEHSVVKDDFMRVQQMLIATTSTADVPFGEFYYFGNHNGPADIHVGYNVLNRKYVSYGNSPVEVDFGKELDRRYRDWKCTWSTKCNGAIIRLTHYNNSVDPVSTPESLVPGEFRASDILDVQLQNPHTGDILPVKNLTWPVRLLFRLAPAPPGMTRSCRYWCGVSWSRKGLSGRELNDTTMECTANHLTAFAIFEEAIRTIPIITTDSVTARTQLPTIDQTASMGTATEPTIRSTATINGQVPAVRETNAVHVRIRGHLEPCPVTGQERDCNGDCGGSARMEPCAHVCYGGKTSLSAADFAHLYDCAHQCNGTFVLDDCSVCAPVTPGTSVYRDCAGRCYPPAKKYDMAMLNECGVCVGGDTGLSEDAGRDQCGVCGGDNSLCVDCRGVPNGKTFPDACGICGGDGRSCFLIASASPAIFPAHKIQSVHVRGAGFDRPDVECLVQNVDGEWTTGEIRNPDNRPDTLDCVLTLPPCTYSLYVQQKGEMINTLLNLTVYNATDVKVTSFGPENITISKTKDATGTFEFWGEGFLQIKQLECVFKGCFSGMTNPVVVSAEAESDNKVTCAVTMPTCPGVLLVFLSANSGVDALGPVFSSMLYASAPVPTIVFSNTGYHLTVTFDKDVDNNHLTCCTYIFDNVTLLGQSSKCWWRGDSVLEVRVGRGSNLVLPGDKLTFKEGAVKTVGEMYSRALSGRYSVGPPLSPPGVTSVIIGPSQISSCGAVTLSGERSSGGMGRDLIYHWTIEPDISVDFERSSATLEFGGEFLKTGMEYTITLTVENFLGSSDATRHLLSRHTEDIPAVSIGPNVDRHRVSISSKVVLTANVELTECSGTDGILYEWSTSVPEYEVRAPTDNKRELVIDPFTFSGGGTINVTVTTRYASDSSRYATASITLNYVQQPLIAIIKGGMDRVVSRVDGLFRLDGSLSHDPDREPGHMAYSWTCIRDCGSYCYSFSEDSLDDIFPFGTAADAPVLAFDGRHLGIKVYLFTLTVSKGKRSAQTTAIIRVKEELLPTITFQPLPSPNVAQKSGVLVSKAYIQSESKIRVTWRLLDESGRSIETEGLKESTFQAEQENKYVSLFQISTANIRGGMSYKLIVRAVDERNHSVEAISEEMYFSRFITGCELTVPNYKQLHMVQLKTAGCQIPEESRPVTYSYSVLFPDGTRRHLSENLLDSTAAVVGPPSQRDDSTVVFSVQVCAMDRLCQEINSSDVNVTKPPRMDVGTVEKVIGRIAKLERAGDFLSALVNMVSLAHSDHSSHHGQSTDQADILLRLVNRTMEERLSESRLRVIIDQLAALHRLKAGTPIAFLRLYLKIIYRYQTEAIPINPEVYRLISSGLSRLRDFLPQSELLIALQALLNSTEASTPLLGETLSFGDSSGAVKVTTSHSLLGNDFTTSDKHTSVEVNFGPELEDMYRDWGCGGERRCSGAVVRLAHYSHSVDPFSAPDSILPEELRASDILDVQLQNPHTGDVLYVANLTSPVRLLFRLPPVAPGVRRSCRYWCGVSWSSKGVTGRELNDTDVECFTNHLSAFAVFDVITTTTADPEQDTSMEPQLALPVESNISTETVVGCAVGSVVIIVFVGLLIRHIKKKKSKVSPSLQTLRDPDDESNA